ncbi:FecR family protein [Chitinophaga sp.]|uniref:FecR family protein n=1 Tax=Chitinophaga sp. TaxID=1869181 RepID=UPI002B6785D6|nr:FecR domain-containing protein [Chitinophaga sp.]HWV69633.1 FecR domain-containing protein [Chitinophaga sp.]
MEHNIFQELLDKYLTGRMTEQEWKIFSRMLKEPAYKSRLEGIIDKELEEHALEGEPDNKVLEAIQNHLQGDISTNRKRSGTIFLYIKRIAVAAVFVLVLATGYWWFALKTPLKNEVAQAGTPDQGVTLPPGGNRAVLKLGNGAMLDLDSLDEGALVQQGRAGIIKLSNGQVAYKPTGDATTAAVYNTIIIPKGGQYQLTLADGTKVWLNASSSLRYPVSFSGKEREVELVGEAYFEVAGNEQMPFHVHANNIDVEVLGTSFNINSYKDEPVVKTTLLEGSVKVTSGKQASKLKPGQEASVMADGEMKLQDNVNTEEVIAWKNGMFQFQAADIETVLRQAARWYDIRIEYKGGISARFSGQISRSANAEQLFKILELTNKVRFEIHGKNIVVRQSGTGSEAVGSQR